MRCHLPRSVESFFKSFFFPLFHAFDRKEIKLSFILI